MKNRVIKLNSRPEGMVLSENFSLHVEEIKELNEGEVLVKTLYLSVDPYMRGRMNNQKSYITPFELQAPLTGRIVGEVINSKSSAFPIGDFVTGMLNWSDYNVVPTNLLTKLVELDRSHLTSALYLTGMPGLTAYIGLINIGVIKENETLVISGAAGAVGMAVGQIGKQLGCRVVGITSSEKKAKVLIEQLHFDEVIVYSDSKDLDNQLSQICSNGVDVYFDNVGGWISDEVIPRMNFHSRIVLCGQISQYNSSEKEVGPRLFPYLLTHSIKVQGFIVGDYAHLFPQVRSQLSKWLNEGKIIQYETIMEGLEQAPTAFIGLFKGQNLGKMIVKISEPSKKGEEE